MSGVLSAAIPAPYTVAPVRGPLARASDVQSARSSSLYAWVALAMAGSYIFESPLRYGLLVVKLPALIYLRDLAAFALIGLAVFSWLTGERRLFPVVVALYALFLHLLVGVFMLPGVIQPLLGLKVFFTFLFGMAAATAIAERASTLLKLSLFAFLATAFGVALDKFVAFPWAGQAYESAIATVQVTREWSSGGVPRLSGFARASFDAATIVLVLLVPILASRWNGFWRALLWALGFATIWLTTSKGALLALLALAVWRALESLRAAKQWVLTWICTFAIACLVLPLAAVQFGFGIRRSSVVHWLSSFMDRVDYMWPDALSGWLDHGSLFIGRGLGGIGFPQLGLEWWRYNAADNLMIYLLVSFGLLALVYVGIFLHRLGSTFAATGSDAFFSRCVRGWAVVLFSYGCTSNMVEQPLMNLLIGVCFGAVTMLWAAGASAQAFQFGFGVHVGQNRNPLQATERAISQSGVNTFRDEVFWHRIETKPGVLAFPDSLKDLDQLVTDAARQKKRPLLILDYGNKFYDNGGQIHSAEGIAAYVRYVRFVVKHFQGRVDQFEVWNEWNIGSGGTDAQRAARHGSPQDYAALLKAAYAAIKEVNPGATVIGGAFAGYDYAWIDAFARAGGFNSLDGFSIHPYVFSEGEKGTPESALKHLDELKSRIDALAPGRDIRIYVTEAGWPIHTGPKGVSEEIAAAYLKQFMLLAKTRPWIAGVWWYDLFDDGDDAANKEHRFGLMTRDGKPRRTFQQLIEIHTSLASPR
jgi:hypothetical protein